MLADFSRDFASRMFDNQGGRKNIKSICEEIQNKELWGPQVPPSKFLMLGLFPAFEGKRGPKHKEFSGEGALAGFSGRGSFWRNPLCLCPFLVPECCPVHCFDHGCVCQHASSTRAISPGCPQGPPAQEVLLGTSGPGVFLIGLDLNNGRKQHQTGWSPTC